MLCLWLLRLIECPASGCKFHLQLFHQTSLKKQSDSWLMLRKTFFPPAAASLRFDLPPKIVSHILKKDCEFIEVGVKYDYNFQWESFSWIVCLGLWPECCQFWSLGKLKIPLQFNITMDCNFLTLDHEMKRQILQCQCKSHVSDEMHFGSINSIYSI